MYLRNAILARSLTIKKGQLLKKLDKLLIVSFIPPFILTFFIALFVLIMQFLWKYIDDIIGKGLDLSVIFELLFYRSTALIPMALPIAVLISSVMVMGNLAERYELASMKSAGIALLRVMLPLIFLVFGVSILSFISSDRLIPYSNLKFKSRLYDIRKQKPALNLEAGTFNDDFGETIIRIAEKSEDGKYLKDVLIYDHTSNRGNDNQIIAKKGEMYTTPNKRFLVMRLFDGNQYQELLPSTREEGDRYQHLRTSFKEWEKIYDMSEFDLNKTNEDLFKNHQSMLSTGQLLHNIDSISKRKETRRLQLNKHVKPFFYHRRRPDSILTAMVDLVSKDSITHISTTFLNTIPKDKRITAINKGISLARNVKNYTRSITDDIPKIQKQITNYAIELHRKLSLAFACLIFLFIGAPMGAIVRKGGFGWPILIAIVFFVFFIILNIIGEKLAKELVVSAAFGMWMPCFVLAPIGMFLTYKAMRDSKLLNLDMYIAILQRIGKRILRIEKEEA